MRSRGGKETPSGRGQCTGGSAKIEILVAKKAGFCMGVQRAYDIAFSATGTPDGPIYSWGPLIHNPQVVSLLERRGLKITSDLTQVKPGIRVIIRSHGIPPQTMEELKVRGASVIDATCPFVRKAQDKAAQLQKEGYQILLLGDRTHPEVQALLGYAKSNVQVVAATSDLHAIDLQEKVGVLSQTTQSEAVLRELVAAAVPRVRELKVFNTICDFSAARSRAALDLAKEVDLLLVVGGKGSANTRQLRDSCREVLPDTHQIESCGDINPLWLEGKRKLGIAAGASTPSWAISDVIARLQDMMADSLESEGERHWENSDKSRRTRR